MQPKFHLAREQTTNLYTAVVQNAVCDFHFHSHVELIIVLEGQIEVTINDQQRVLTCGELAIALSYDAHQFRALTQSRSLCVIIPTDMCPDFISAVSDQKNCNPFLQDASLFETVCSCFHRIQKAENSINKKGYVFVLLGTVLKHMQLEQKTDVTDPRLLTDITQKIFPSAPLPRIWATMPATFPDAFLKIFRSGSPDTLPCCGCARLFC